MKYVPIKYLGCCCFIGYCIGLAVTLLDAKLYLVVMVIAFNVMQSKQEVKSMPGNS